MEKTGDEISRVNFIYMSVYIKRPTKVSEDHSSLKIRRYKVYLHENTTVDTHAITHTHGTSCHDGYMWVHGYT